MALKTIRKNKSAIVYIFALSILAVIACDVLCSIDRSAEVEANIHASLASTHRMEEVIRAHHKHDESHKHHASTGDTTQHTHSSSSSDQDSDCCKDITSQFYKSLFNGSYAGAVKAKVHTFIILAAPYNNYPLTAILYRNPLGIIFYIPPEIAGSNLRILISSFLI